MAIINFLSNHPRTRNLWRLTLSPRTPDFFHQNDRKECTLHSLDGLGHFLFGFGATGKILEGVVTTPW